MDKIFKPYLIYDEEDKLVEDFILENSNNYRLDKNNQANYVDINRHNFVYEVNNCFIKYNSYDELFDRVFEVTSKYNSFKKAINQGKFDLVEYSTYCIYSILEIQSDISLGNLIIRFTMFPIKNETARKRFIKIMKQLEEK